MVKRPIAAIQMASGSQIIVELYPEHAPNTVNSFIWLANQGAFDNWDIERIVPDFVIQPSYTAFDRAPLCDFVIEGEFRENGFDNPLTLSKYTVAMGGDGETLASGSCFFIAVGDVETRLDGKYAGFGRVTAGFEELERLTRVPLKTVETDLPGAVVRAPEVPERIIQIRVDTFGVTYPEPLRTKGVWAYEIKQLQQGGIYKHYKGGMYRVLHLGLDSETTEAVVVYEALDGGQVWVRPLEMFVSYVKLETGSVRRFSLVREETAEA